jgi:hypothetical protein
MGQDAGSFNVFKATTTTFTSVYSGVQTERFIGGYI